MPAPLASPRSISTSSTNGGPGGSGRLSRPPTPRHLHRSEQHVYAFYSIAHDMAGYSELKKPTVEASTVLPFLNPPVTRWRPPARKREWHVYAEPIRHRHRRPRPGLRDLNGGGTGTPVSLQGLLTVIDNAIEIDFGTGGIGGNPATTAADGYYALSFTPTGSQPGVGSTHHFYRLLGDANGVGVVNQNDLNAIAAARGQSVSQIANAIGQPATSLTPLSMDVNGDGSVNTTDLVLATRSKGNKLTLPPGATLG